MRFVSNKTKNAVMFFIEKTIFIRLYLTRKCLFQANMNTTGNHHTEMKQQYYYAYIKYVILAHHPKKIGHFTHINLCAMKFNKSFCVIFSKSISAQNANN